MIIDTIHRFSRGVVAYGILDFEPMSDIRAFAKFDTAAVNGARVKVIGIEAFAKLGAPRKGDRIGVMMPADAPVRVGDDVDLMAPADIVCTLCGAAAHFADDGVYRHKNDALQDASTYCDRYGYPIEVREKAP